VVAAYRGYWRLAAVFDSRYPQVRWRTVLSAVAVDPLLSRAVSAARVQHTNGIAVYGQVVPRPTVLAVNGRPRATVRDCADGSHAGQADAATGRHRTVGAARLPVVATVVRGRDGRWRVSDLSFPGGRC
jgi:hypothetical protein